MASEVVAGLGIFKTLFDMARGLKDMNDATVRNAAVIALQEQILSAREAQEELVESVNALKTQLAQFEHWDKEKEKYNLVELEPDSFAYAIKQEAQGKQPAHVICANCFENRAKSILQRKDLGHLRCPSCGSVIRVRDPRQQSITREGPTWRHR